MDSVVFTARLPYWMVRTRPFAERRWLLLIRDDESNADNVIPPNWNHKRDKSFTTNAGSPAGYAVRVGEVPPESATNSATW